MKQIRPTFGELIKARRVQLAQKHWRSFTSRRIAGLAGISEQRLCDYEAGRRKPNTDFVIEQLAKALSLPVGVVYYSLDRIPPRMRGLPTTSARTITEAYESMEKALKSPVEQEG